MSIMLNIFSLIGLNSALYSSRLFAKLPEAIGNGAVKSMNITRQRSLEGWGQHVLDYMKHMQAENSDFYYAIQGDHSHSNANIFWADATSRINYTYFGDTVVVDTSSRANGYEVPFATFTGVNHHGQPVLFGCALLLDESEASYVWLFQTWLHAMSGKAPLSITTEPDRFVQMAAVHVFPNTRLRYCRWSMFRETRSHLGHVYKSYPTFEVEFRKVVEESETTEEFDSNWATLLTKYYLIDDEWLQSVYDARHQWVPVYLRDTFFGELQSNDEGHDRKITYFDEFINSSTTIQDLIKQYEKGVTSWHEKEMKADDDTSNTTPVLKTPSPMEKQVANLLTQKIFTKFQDELVETLAIPATKLVESETITTFRVAKFGEEHKAHVVSFSLETKASCSCRMFEYSGIVCRHILSVFRAKNVLSLPSQYVMRRWTRNARKGAENCESSSQEPANSSESMNVRYSNLQQEAMKFVEEGAKSVHVYNVAMDALREASAKVASVKNQVPQVSQGGSLAIGDNQGASVLSAEEKAQKIQELTAELENTNKRCELYRTNLFAVIKEMEDQKLKLSVKVHNVRLRLKENMDTSLTDTSVSPNIPDLLNISDDQSVNHSEMILDDYIPKLDMQFENEDDAYNFYNEYSRRTGFGVRKEYRNISRKDGVMTSRKFSCHREGRREGERAAEQKGFSTKDGRAESRTGCHACMIICLDRKVGKYKVSHFVEEHNHPLQPPGYVHAVRS